MGYLPSLRNNAVHIVSNLTSALLNPISDEPSSPSVPSEEVGVVNPEEEAVDVESAVPDGPDTSSFTAFLVSLLSPADSGSHPSKESTLNRSEEWDGTSGSGVKESAARKSLLSKSKQSLGRVIHKAARISGFRQSSEPKVDPSLRRDSKLVEHELKPVKIPNETASRLILPDISEPSLLLSENIRNGLYASLPSLAQGRKWVLLYSTWRHGISLSTLYRRSMLCPGYCLLAVGDQKGAVFGGLVEAPLRPTKKYQGTNNSFVFTNLSSHPVIFRPTGANHYFTLCATDFLALGGGGHFALYLDGELLNGSSSTSETFDNSCLAHSQEFVVKEVELWGFVYASKYDETIAQCRTEKPGICRW